MARIGMEGEGRRENVGVTYGHDGLRRCALGLGGVRMQKGVGLISLPNLLVSLVSKAGRWGSFHVRFRFKRCAAAARRLQTSE